MNPEMPPVPSEAPNKFFKKNKPAVNESGGGFLQKFNKPAKRTAGAMAAILGASMLPLGDQKISSQSESIGVTRAKEKNQETDLDLIKNKTSAQIAEDFPQLGSEDWRRIIMTYDDGYIYYVGKIGRDTFVLKNQDGQEVILQISGWQLASRVMGRQKPDSSKEVLAAPKAKLDEQRRKVWDLLIAEIGDNLPPGSEDTAVGLLVSMPDSLVEEIEHNPQRLKRVAADLLENAQDYIEVERVRQQSIQNNQDNLN